MDNCHGNSITVRAAGKINLSLRVTGRRPDGYHTIDTVMHETGLCDTVTVSLGGSGITVDCPGDIAPQCNLAYRAAQVYLDALGRGTGADTCDMYDTCAHAGDTDTHAGDTGAHTDTHADAHMGVHIRIEKRIPVSGGMAGGSADAAAVLRALDSLIGGVSRAELEKAALSLGADVPFCLAGGTMHCTGVGEIMTPCRPLPPHRLMIVGGCGEKRSTAAMYSELDACLGQAAGGESADPDRCTGEYDMVGALASGELGRVCAALHNDFELVNPACSAVRSCLIGSGASGALLSGSGPTVFGLFEPDFDTAAAARAVEAAGYRVLYIGV